MTSVLFVDDQAEVLAELERGLRPQAPTWDMEFAVGGHAALTILEHRPFDVVVSDTAMADVGGAELLRWIRVQQPSTVRIVLASQSGSTSLRRSLAVAHQSLTKPCDPALLVSAVEQVGRVLARITDAKVLAAIGGLDRLPSPSSSVLGLGRLFEEDPVDIDRVAALVRTDIAMTTKILQLVNSAFFGLPRTITDPREAIAYLGLDALRDTAVSAALFQSFQDMPAVTRFAEQVQLIGTCRADMAFSLARIAGHKVASAREVWLAAFLADIGAVALVAAHPDRADAVLAHVDPERREQNPDSREVISAVGAYLLSVWGLPHTLVESVALSAELPRTSHSTAAGFTWLASQLMFDDPAIVDAIGIDQLAALGLRPELLPTRI